MMTLNGKLKHLTGKADDIPTSVSANRQTTIRQFSINYFRNKDSTGKEIAKERGGIWTGCGQIDDYEQETDDNGDYEIDEAVGFDPDICGDRL